MAVLINGNGYSPVTAQQDADLYAGLVGNSTMVLSVGNEMAAQIINSNTVRILDGEAVSQGRRIHLDPGSYDDFTIPTGTQGVVSRYIIGYHIYTDGSGNELVETFVQQIQTADERIPEAQMRDGATDSYVSLYRVTVNGTTIITPTALYAKRPAQLIQHGAQEFGASINANSYESNRINFAYPFKTPPTVVCSLHLNSAYADVGEMEIVTTEITTTYFIARIHNNSAERKSARYNWIAIAND